MLKILSDKENFESFIKILRNLKMHANYKEETKLLNLCKIVKTFFFLK